MAEDVYYEAALVDRVMAQSTAPTFNEVGRIIALDKLSWSKELNQDGFASVSTRPERVHPDIATRLLAPDENPLELWVYRDGVKVYAGPLIGYQVQGSKNTITLHSRGLAYYLRYMYVLADRDYTTDGLGATDTGTIAKWLVDQWQANDYGDFGIDTSGMGTTGTTREILYERASLVSVPKALTELGKPNAGGFDWDINPDTRVMTLYTPQRGSDKSSTAILDSRNLMFPSYYVDLTAGDFATTALVTGTDYELTAPLWSERTNSTRRAQFGYAAIAADYDGVLAQSTLNEFAQALIDRHSDFRLSLGGSGGTESGGATKLYPVEGFGPLDVDPGDTISVLADFGFGQFNLALDVSKIVTEVNNEGSEQMSIAVV